MQGLAEKLAAAVTLLVILLSFVAGVFFIPYLMAESAMPEGAGLSLYLDSAGSLTLGWPEAEDSDGYLIQIAALDAAGEHFSLVSEEVCIYPHCALPPLPEDVLVHLQVNTRKEYRVLGRSRVRLGNAPLVAETYLNVPGFAGLAKLCDPEGGRVLISWTGWKGDSYQLYRRDGDGVAQPLWTVDKAGVLLSFGEGGEFPLPAEGECYTFCLDALRRQEGLTFYGGMSGDVSVTLDDLLGRTTAPDFAAALAESEATAEPRAAPEPEEGMPAPPAALEDAPLPEPVPTVEPVSVRAVPETQYAVVWPMRDLPAYDASTWGAQVGTALASASYCILDAADGRFLVRLAPERYGWIDSRQCMINLTDYLGELCAYDIANSYASLYRVHGAPIAQVSDTVIEGYEQVRTGPGEYLVPLLWPVAEKLAKAAEAVLADGYRLKIYDSFRPNSATRAIYDYTNAILDQALPEPGEGGAATYRQLMTNGTWGLSNFLAYGTSMHNYGVAVDLTLERLEDGQELEMQTAMHDLSWFSVISRNNDNAALLDRYMKAAGFGGLVSEWWHFQDNESYASLPMANRREGVTAEGWRADGRGWRYRRADGSWCAAVELELEGRTCQFDAEGYLIEEE